MKFIHAADLHLDSPLRGLSKHEDAPAEALRDATRQAFENLVDLALEEQVSFVLLAGDLYDGTWQDFNTAIFLARKLGELGRAGIRVHAVVGNHDAQNKITRALERPENLTLFSDKKPETVVLEDLEVAIHGQSYGQQHVIENLAAGFPAAQPGMFNIGILHTSLNGREGHASYAPCSLDDLTSKGYQYWALGHVHQSEVVSDDPWIVFPGCLQGRSIREIGPKGCYLVTVEDANVETVEWRALDVVRWSRCDVDLAGVDTLEGMLDASREALAKAIDEAEGRILATRLRLVGSTALHPVLHAQAYTLQQSVAKVAAEVGGEDVWLEKVELATTPGRDREVLLAGESVLGTLARDVLEAPDTVDSVPGLDGILAELRKKVPPEVFLEDHGLDLDDPSVQEKLIREGKELLIEELLEVGGEA